MLTRPARGITIIELLTGLIIVGILLMLALPSFVQMLHNSKLRAGAESISTALQAARSEALRQNRQVEFLLTDTEPTEDNVAGPNVNTTGPHWMVRANTTAGFRLVEGRSGYEGSNQAGTTVVQIAAVVNSSPAATTAGTVTFNAVGRAELLADATFDVSNPAGGACKTAGGSEPMRCLRVVVTPGGRVRMCDPSVTDLTDTRAC